MIQNYLLIAFRNLKRNLGFTIINILGLAIGIACFVIITLYINYELGYDNFHNNADDIYRVINQWEEESYAGTPATVGPIFKQALPEVKNYLRIGRTSWDKKVPVSTENNNYYEDQFYLADSTFFEIFSYKLLSGNPETVLDDPYSVVITQSIASKYFQNEDPIGKVITLNNKFHFTVSGVAEDANIHSHFQFKFIIPFPRIVEIYGKNSISSWGSYNYFTYLQLYNNTNIEAFKQKAADYIVTYLGNEKRRDTFKNFHYQPLKKIHLEIVRGNIIPAIDISYIYVFSGIAFLILIIACINFMNLSTARSIKRAREVGLRKVLGANRQNLIKQFLGESLIITFFSLILGIGLVELFIPTLNSITDVSISINLFNIPFLLWLLVIGLFVGIVSGSYPAFYISRYQPVKVMKAGIISDGKRSWLRNTLVVFQLSISIILLISTIAIFRQINYIHNKNLGLNKENVLNIPLYEKQIREKADYFKAELLQSPYIESVSANRFLPSRNTWHHSIYWEGQGEEEYGSMWVFIVDEDFMKTYQVNIIDGRNFSKEFSTDPDLAYILNESAVKLLGWENPLGKKFSAWGDQNMGTVIGVVENFHFRSMHHQIEPCCIKLNSEYNDQLSIKFSGGNADKVLDYIEQKWKLFAGDKAFEYFFIDEDFDNLYKTESRLISLVEYFAVLSLFISCLGLFGLVSHTTKQRTKEIGIRKVYGGSVGNIVSSISKTFSLLMLVAILIAWPVSWGIINRWLENFAYSIDISIWIFVLGALIAIVISALIVIYQTIKTANTNPVEILKYE